MATNSTRELNRVSTAEIQRRWQGVRAQMRSRGIDVLVLQNSSDWVGGYIRWFCNEPATNGYPSSLVVPLEGGVILIEQGPFGGQRDAANEEASKFGIARRLTTPSYPSVAYTGTYDADLAVSECRRLGARHVGLVAPAAMYHSFGAHLSSTLSANGITLSDATDFVDRLKAIKSPEEQGLMRQVAHMQDSVMGQLREFIRPGLRDFEVAAYAQYLGQQLGSEQGIFLGSSAPAGTAAKFQSRFNQGRTLQAGDVYSQLIENNGAGGYYTELSRIFVLGKASGEMRDAHAQVLEAQRFALSLLKPGVEAREVFARHNDWLRSQHLPEERRLSIHGMGYDMVERPLIRADEDMRIETGMAIIVHPGLLNERMFIHNTDIYMIGEDGPGECIHRTPKQIFELA
jgi:Xaa-Pro aminopeptidase